MNKICDHFEDTIDYLEVNLPSNAVVHKDECMYCFDTATCNEKGLDVCMKCFQSFSRGEKNHTEKHFNESGHEFYLNIKKRLKERDDEGSNGKQRNERQNKMAKLEIQETNIDDLYETETHIYCAKCNNVYLKENVPEKVSNLATVMIQATSSNKTEEIKSWEYERVPCPHCFDILQNPKEDINLKKCDSCDLQENLWICLCCGAVGCGREQFGSALRGNSHALSHYEISKHPLAVKLGSLSPDEESCDVYCYECNDEVKVPHLSKLLRTFEIDIELSVQTEKNLVELNLDQNLNWQFNLDGANGEKLEPIYGPGLTGLQNLGNSCYLNSIMQVCFGFPNYDRFFSSLDLPSYQEVKNPSEDITTQLIKLNDGLNSGRYSYPNKLDGAGYQSGIRPLYFKKLIGENHPEFKTNKQQDSFEFLLFFLDRIEKEFGLKLNEPFKFLIGTKILCSSCMHGNIEYDLVDNLSLQIEDKLISVDELSKKRIYEEVAIEDSFEQFHSKEDIEGFQCDYCKTTSVAWKTSWLRTLPKILAVNLSRIKLENWVPYKVEVPVQIPNSIELAKYTTVEENPDEVLSEKKSSESDTFSPDSEAMSMLLGMGFPEVRCLKALYYTGNKDAEAAANWLFSHMDDPDIDEPLDIHGKQNESNEVPIEQIESLAAMGFDFKVARKALILNDNDINKSVEWLFSNPDDDGIIPETSAPTQNLREQVKQLKDSLLCGPKEGPTKYSLRAIVCHKGSSPHTGHYVAYIKKEIKGESHWVLFNDEKVVLCDPASLEDAKETSYIYFFELDD